MRSRFLLFAFFMSVASLGFSQKHEIKGKVNGLADSTCILAHYSGDSRIPIDTALIGKDGQFVFSGPNYLKGGIYMIQFPLAKGKALLEFLVTNQKFSFETDTTDFVGSTIFANSMENTLYYKNLRDEKPIRKNIEIWTEEFKALENKKSKKANKIRQNLIDADQSLIDAKKEIINKYPTTFLAKLYKSTLAIEIPESVDSAKKFYYKRDHFFDNIDFGDSRLTRTPILKAKIDFYLDKMIYQHPDSIIIASNLIIQKARRDSAMFKFVLSNIGSKYEHNKTVCFDKIMVWIFQTYYKKHAWWISEKNKKSIDQYITRHGWILCERKPPNLNFPDTNNVKHDLYKQKGDRILVYFWSATCSHCKRTTPKVGALYEELKEKGFNVYACCIDSHDEPYKTFIKKHNLNYVNVRDGKNTDYYRNKYDVFSTPKMYVLDEDKKICLKQVDFNTIKDYLYGHYGIEKEEEKPEEKGH